MTFQGGNVLFFSCLTRTAGQCDGVAQPPEGAGNGVPFSSWDEDVLRFEALRTAQPGLGLYYHKVEDDLPDSFQLPMSREHCATIEMLP